MKAVYLLHRDGRVTKVKKSIAKLRDSGALNDVQYLLLPIATKKSIYLAVLGDFLNAEEFHKMTIRLHMQLIGGVHGPGVDIPPWDNYVAPLFDYWTTTIEANTWEEFYHVIHIAITNYMVEFMQHGALNYGHALTAYPGPINYFRIQDMSIRCMDGDGKDLEEPFEWHMDDHLFGVIEDHLDLPDIDEHISGNSKLCEVLMERYGLYVGKAGGRGWEWSIREDEQGNLTWRKEYQIGNLFSDVKKVIFNSGDPCSPFMMLSDDDYDQLVRLQTADIYLVPFSWAPEKYMDEKPDAKMLSVTTYLDVPRYEFTLDNDSPAAFQNALAMMDSYMGDCIASYQYTDETSIAFMLAYLQDLMEVACETCKVEQAEVLNTNDLYGLSLWCTVMVDVILEASESTPATKYLHVMTDRYQDVPVDVPTVCYLLGLEEKSHN